MEGSCGLVRGEWGEEREGKRWRREKGDGRREKGKKSKRRKEESGVGGGVLVV